MTYQVGDRARIYNLPIFCTSSHRGIPLWFSKRLEHYGKRVVIRGKFHISGRVVYKLSSEDGGLIPFFWSENELKPVFTSEAEFQAASKERIQTLFKK